jgi:hypothetical protein
MDVSFDELVKRMKRWNELKLKAEVSIDDLVKSI